MLIGDRQGVKETGWPHLAVAVIRGANCPLGQETLRPGGMPYNRRMASSSDGDPVGGGSHSSRNASRHRAMLASAPRVVVVGCTGSGKTTFARGIARLLDVPHVELDSLNWEPNWTAAETDVFRQRAREALAGDAWVVEGNYSAVRDLVWPRAAMLVWLNLPFRVVWWRLLWRTLRRAVKKEELWNGNREIFTTQFLSRDSLFVWQVRSYGRLLRTIPEALEQPEHAHLEVVTLRSAGVVREWLAGLGDASGQT